MRFTRRFIGMMALIFVTSAACFACSCFEPRSVGESFQQADVVFLGQAVRGDYPYGEHTFRVLKSWKGVDDNRIVVGASSTDLGYAFVLGELYVVYAHRSGGELVAGSCSGTRALMNASEQLRDLQDRPASSMLPRFRGGYGYGPMQRSFVLGHKPRRSFLNVTLLTGVSVLSFITVGFMLPRLRKRFASWRGNK